MAADIPAGPPPMISTSASSTYLSILTPKCSAKRNKTHVSYTRVKQIYINGYISIITNTMHCLSSVYWVITPPHVSGTSAAHHQEVEFIYAANGTCYPVQLTVSGPDLLTVNSEGLCNY
jgi:hypothetical protein